MPSNENCADMFTKNLPSKFFEKHTQRFCGKEYPNLFQLEGAGVTDKGVGESATNDERNFYAPESNVTEVTEVYKL